MLGGNSSPSSSTCGDNRSPARSTRRRRSSTSTRSNAMTRSWASFSRSQWSSAACAVRSCVSVVSSLTEIISIQRVRSSSHWARSAERSTARSSTAFSRALRNSSLLAPMSAVTVAPTPPSNAAITVSLIGTLYQPASFVLFNSSRTIARTCAEVRPVPPPPVPALNPARISSSFAIMTGLW